MNRTILCITAIIASALTIAALLISRWYIDYLYLRTTGSVSMDRFTQCIQIVMSESRQSGKIIDAEKAKDICVHAKDNK